MCRIIHASEASFPKLRSDYPLFYDKPFFLPLQNQNPCCSLIFANTFQLEFASAVEPTAVVGTHVLLEASRHYGGIKRFIHVSTDEVYGENIETDDNEGQFNEATTSMCPTNPYAATKAGAEMLCNSYKISYNLPIIITRGNNVYGPRQYPEKLIPKFIQLALAGRKFTVHGEGQQMRSYMYVEDVAEAFCFVLHKGVTGEIYNIGTLHERTVMSVACEICKCFGLDPKDQIVHVRDRLFNDARYWMDNSKLRVLGWEERTTWEVGFKETVDWYKAHQEGHWPSIEGALAAHPGDVLDEKPFTMEAASAALHKKHDQAYWDAYYAKRPADIAKPSSFAEWAWEFLSALPESERGSTLVDLGCGNGRDSEFFGDKFSVIGVDNSATAIKTNNEIVSKLATYKYGSITAFTAVVSSVDVAYSRFVLHALQVPAQTALLAECAKALAPGGFLIVETRSTSDPLCGDGIAVEGEDNAWLSDTNRDSVSKHYRRFQSLETLTKDVESHGFKVVQAYNDTENSWHKTDHAAVIRMIACRK